LDQEARDYSHGRWQAGRADPLPLQGPFVDAGGHHQGGHARKAGCLPGDYHLQGTPELLHPDLSTVCSFPQLKHSSAPQNYLVISLSYRLSHLGWFTGCLTWDDNLKLDRPSLLPSLHPISFCVIDIPLLFMVSLDYTSLFMASLDYTSLFMVSLDYTSLFMASLDYTSLFMASLDYTSLVMVSREDVIASSSSSLDYTSLFMTSLDYTSSHHHDSMSPYEIWCLLRKSVHLNSAGGVLWLSLLPVIGLAFWNLTGESQHQTQYNFDQRNKHWERRNPEIAWG